MDDVFRALGGSPFRRRFKLGQRESEYLDSRGLDTVMLHARDFVARRLAPSHLDRDGKQTPFRGHPVFVAQHATATCCRSCIEKWHSIRRGRELSEVEQQHVLEALRRWLKSGSL